MRKVYLDNVAAMPLLPEVREAMLPFLGEVFGNPQSLHSWGDGARDAVEEARERVAVLIGGSAEEIIFTSCGTESNNLALRGIARAKVEKGKHIVISSIEHFSVMNTVRTLEKEGFEVTMVPVDEHGMVDPEEVGRSIRPDTVLVSIMLANGEVGTIQPLAKIAEKLPKNGPVFHTDAVAATGNIPVNVKELGVQCAQPGG